MLSFGVITGYLSTRPPASPAFQPGSQLIGVAAVLAAFDRHDCLVARIYVTRRLEPALVRRLERRFGDTLPIVELSAADLTLLAGGNQHDGIIVVLGPPPGRQCLLVRGLWGLVRLALSDPAKRPSL